MFSKKHDVFIAYHGTYSEGSSYLEAYKIYNYLTSKDFRCFFFPEEGNDSYKSNMIDVIESRTFLFICNSNLHRDDNGALDRNNHYELYVETDAFYGAIQTGRDVSIKDAKVVAVGYDWKRGDEERLHPLFAGRTHIYQSDGDEYIYEIEKWIDERIGEQIENKRFIGRSDITRTYLKRSDMITDLDIKRRIRSGHRIYAMGISNSELMRFEYDIFTEAIAKGGVFKILFLDPNGEATRHREIEENLRGERIKLTTHTNLRIAEDIYYELSESRRSAFEIRIYNRCPRINLLIIDEIAILQYYDSFNRGMNNPSFLIEQNGDNQLFDYCLSRFNEMVLESEEYGFE